MIKILAEYSIIELIVYGLIGYAGVMALIVSTLIEPPATVSFAGLRAIWLVPSIIALVMLSFSTGEIIYETVTIETQNERLLESRYTPTTNGTTVETKSVTLVNEFWIPFHFLLASIVSMYVMIQILNLLTKIK